MQNIGGIVAVHYAPLLAAATNQLPLSTSAWGGVALLAILVVLLVAAIVYMLGSAINSQSYLAWSKFQMYEALLSLILLLIFGSVTYVFFTNPQTIYGSVNLVPTGCTSATQFFTLATCDVSLFNNATYGIARYTFYATYLSSLLNVGSTKDDIPIVDSPYIKIIIPYPSIFPPAIQTSLPYFTVHCWLQSYSTRCSS